METLQKLTQEANEIIEKNPYTWGFPFIDYLEDKESHLAIRWVFYFLTKYQSDYEWVTEYLDIPLILSDLENSILDIQPFKKIKEQKEARYLYFYQKYDPGFKRVDAFNNLDWLYYTEFRYQLGDMETYRKRLALPLLSELNYDYENETHLYYLTEDCFKAIEEFKNYM